MALILEVAALSRRKKGPSSRLVEAFSDPRWFQAGWFPFPEDPGQEEGQIVVPSGGNDNARVRWIELENILAPVIEGEPVWVQCGVRAIAPPDFKNKDWDRYEEFRGYMEEWTRPYRGGRIKRDGSNLAEKVRDAFATVGQITKNLIEDDFYVEFLMVRVTFGRKPE